MAQPNIGDSGEIYGILRTFDEAIELARATLIPGWPGNLNLGLAELTLDRNGCDVGIHSNGGNPKLANCNTPTTTPIGIRIITHPQNPPRFRALRNMPTLTQIE
jgi:hypothetical protein